METDFLDELAGIEREAIEARQNVPKKRAVIQTPAPIVPVKWELGMDITPGFYDMPFEVYHSQSQLKTRHLSSSVAKVLINQSPIHADYYCRNLREPTREMDMGQIVHTNLLGKGHEIEIGDFPDYRTNESKAWRTVCREDGRIPILKHQHDAAQVMFEVVRNQIMGMDIRSFFSASCQSEIAGYCEIDGCPVQTLMDRVDFETGTIYDLKTITSAHPKKITAQIINMGYDIQEALYLKVFTKVAPWFAGRAQFIFIFIETTPPYAVTPVRLSGMGHEIGDFKVMRAIEMWQKCQKSGNWPGYTETTLSIDPPGWALSEEMGYASSNDEF